MTTAYRSAALPFVLVAMLGTGCGLSHEPPPPDDAAIADLGVDAGSRDLGADVRDDTGALDAGAGDLGLDGGPPVARTGDIDGDGYADILVGAPRTLADGTVSLFLGGRRALSTTAESTFVGPLTSGDEFGEALAKTGDVNGDGYTDFVIGSYIESATFYLGGPPGVPLRSTTLAPLDGTFGIRVASAGDVNRDGYSDVMIGAAGTAGDAATPGWIGHAYVYFGGAAGLASSPAVTLAGVEGENGHFDTVASAGDVNGDGYPDVMVGAQAIIDGVHWWMLGGGVTSSCLDTRRVFVYFGSAAGLATTPSARITGSIGGILYCRFSDAIVAAADVNGDGFSDILLGAPAIGSTGAIDVYMGSRTGPSTMTTLVGVPGDSLGAAAANAGDVNSDGYDDVIVGALYADGGAGRAYLYLGSPSGLSTASRITILAPAGGGFGSSVAGVGDVNGDGYPDIAVGAWGLESGIPGHAYVYFGGPSGVATTPAVTWDSSDATAIFGATLG